MYFLLTARAHVNEVQIFEDFLSIFLPDIQKRKEYYYAVEKDDTCDRHLHVVINDPAPDRPNFIKKFKKKIYEEFKNSLKDTQTQWDNEFKYKFLRIDQIKKGEEQFKIGYVFKEGDNRRKSSTATDEYITQCVKAHHAKERMDSRKVHEDDVTSVTAKNFHAKVNEYVRNNEEYDYNNQLLQYSMVRSNYSFLQMSKYQTAKGFRELRIMKGKEYEQDMTDVRREMFEDRENNEQQILQDLKSLLFDPPDDGITFAKLKYKYYWLEDRNFL